MVPSCLLCVVPSGGCRLKYTTSLPLLFLLTEETELLSKSIYIKPVISFSHVFMLMQAFVCMKTSSVTADISTTE